MDLKLLGLEWCRRELERVDPLWLRQHQGDEKWVPMVVAHLQGARERLRRVWRVEREVERGPEPWPLLERPHERRA